MDLDVRPVSGALGAEVRGVDLAHVDDGQWARIHALWLEHLVLFFPDQHLDPDAHIRLGRRLGEVEIHPFIRKLDDAHPEIVVLDSERGEKADVWHTDVTFSPTPPRASILRMARNPAVGGDTIWTNQYLAFASLSAPLRELLDGLHALHSAAPFGHPEITTVHPVVRIHPETGRRSLFVNRTFTSHIVEMRRSESDALLAYLYAWSEQVQFQCRYRWTAGAVGMWDNRCTQHYAVNDYDERRVIERVTVIGDVPAGAAGRHQPFESQQASAVDAVANAGRNGKALDPRANSLP